MPNAQTLKANEDQYELKTYSDRSGSTVVVTDALSRFHRVRLRGRRVLNCFSIGMTDEDLRAGWDVVGYISAASTQPGYPSINEWDARQQADKIWRLQSQYETTFKRFEFPPDWDYRGRGEKFAIPGVDVWNQSPDYSWIPGVRVAQGLPLAVGVDYSGNNTPATSVGPYLEPFVVFKYPFGAGNRYIDSRSISDFDGVDHPDSARFGWSANVRPLSDAPGFDLDVSGLPKHVIDFDGVGPWQPTDERLAGWELDEAIFTLAVWSDSFCEVTLMSGVAPEDLIREKMILVGDAFQLNFLAANTVVGLDGAGELIEHTSGGYVRDDRDKLMPLARLAADWYGKDRRALSFSSTFVMKALPLGGLVTKLLGGDLPDQVVNSVVTQFSIRADRVFSEAGESASPSMMDWRTGFAEIDVLGF